MEEEDLFVNNIEKNEDEIDTKEEVSVKKQRKPLSEERKQALKEQLKKAREASMAKRKAGKEAKQKAIEVVKKQIKTPTNELNVPYNMLKDEITGLKEMIKNLQLNNVNLSHVEKMEEPPKQEMRIETPKFDIDLEDVDDEPIIKPPTPLILKPKVKEVKEVKEVKVKERTQTPVEVKNFINHYTSSSFKNSYF